MKFSIRDLIWLITVVAIACILWVHGKQRERAAIEREQAVRQRLATTELMVQQLEEQKQQQAMYAEREMARIKRQLENALNNSDLNK